MNVIFTSGVMRSSRMTVSNNFVNSFIHKKYQIKCIVCPHFYVAASKISQLIFFSLDLMNQFRFQDLVSIHEIGRKIFSFSSRNTRLKEICPGSRLKKIRFLVKTPVSNILIFNFRNPEAQDCVKNSSFSSKISIIIQLLKLPAT